MTCLVAQALTTHKSSWASRGFEVWLTSVGGFAICFLVDALLQGLGGDSLAQAHVLHRVGVAGHEGYPLGVVSVRAQQGQDLVFAVRQDQVALQLDCRCRCRCRCFLGLMFDFEGRQNCASLR